MTSTPQDRITLRFLAAPADAAPADPAQGGAVVSAGHVLEWIDRAGYACAAGWSGSYCVTAYVGNVHFTRPIRVGALVEASARVIATGRSSMQVLVTVRSADATGGEFAFATHCLLVFVAMDADRRPRAVPQWLPASAADAALERRATTRIDVRARIRTAMSAQRFTEAGTTPQLLLRFLASPSDVNWGGSVHGGTVMRWIDEASQACASGWVHRPTVAVYAGGIQFHRPIAIGALVEVEARVIHSTARSLHIATRVHSWLPTGSGVPRAAHLTTECMTVAVAVGADGRAAPVEPIALVSDEDVRLDAHARELVAMRAELDAIDERDDATPTPTPTPTPTE